MKLSSIKLSLGSFVRFLTVSFVFATTSWTAHGAELCTYIAYSPAAVQQRIFNNFAAIGIAYLNNPEAFFADEQDMLEQIGDRDAVLLRNNQIIATLDIHQDALTGSTRITYYTPANAAQESILLDLEETRSTCYVRGVAGVCNSSSLRTYLGTTAESNLDAPDFTITETPAGVDYYRFGQLQPSGAGVTLFASAFQDSIDWFNNYLQTPTRTLLLNPTTKLGSIYLTLASDAYFYPYLNMIRIHEIQGELVITGVLPTSMSLTYLIQKLADMGHYRIRNQTILDSAIRPLPPELPLTRACI